MQIAGTTSQAATATAATTTPVQPLGSPTSTMSQTGNVVMVIIIEKALYLSNLYVHVNLYVCTSLILIIIEQR